jgi:hypothetical protein
MRARMYEPLTGRFVQRDVLTASIEDPQSLNRYTYTRNNPTTLRDPSGKIAIAPFLIACGVGAASSVVFDVVGNLVSGTQTTWEDAGKSAGSGCAFGLVGFGVGKIVGKALGGLVAKAGANWRFGPLPSGVLGSTDRYGAITIAQGLTGSTLRETIRHESIHAFLTPRIGPFLTQRTALNIWSYTHSHLHRFVEEALAESYATGSVRLGVNLALTQYDVSMWRLGAETAVGFGLVGGGGYGLSHAAGQP